MQHVYNPTSRRRMLKIISGGIVCLGTSHLGLLSAKDELPHLTDANPAAASLDYTEDSNSVDNRKFPKHTAAQRCATCRFFQAGAGTQYAPCQLYPGNAVNVNGWCAGYAAT
jgi:hypothetical protein